MKKEEEQRRDAIADAIYVRLVAAALAVPGNTVDTGAAWKSAKLASETPVRLKPTDLIAAPVTAKK
ncbi:hypothetical protein JY460_05870 [Stenotrophomonas maltophilia]|nr:hypothetical protein [Stenotrophomonas maltophilia]